MLDSSVQKMKPTRRYIEHTADVLFEAEAATLGELFEQCGMAIEESQVELKNVEPKKEVTINGENQSVESLLFDFLDDLLFHKDSDGLIFSKFVAKVEEKGGIFRLRCQAFGEEFDADKHEQLVDAKAITMHMFEVKKTEEGWRAKVLVDI